METKQKGKFEKFVFFFVFVTLVASTVWIIISMALAPTESDVPHQRVKGDYVLMLLQCLVGIVAMGLPSLVERKVGVNIPSHMMLLYALFLYCSIYLGEVRSFYMQFAHWDTVLHTFSGVMLGTLGFSVISLLNKTDRVPVNLSPAFVAVFTFCFAVSVGVVWEVYEFAVDLLFSTNMQKAEPFIGRAAVYDTMLDLIVDSIGGLVVALIGYVSLKFKKGWVEKLLLHTHKKEKKAE